MSYWEITPFVGVGELRFGTPRPETRALIGQNFETIKISPLDINTTDVYKEAGLHLEYDQQDNLETVVVWFWAYPDYADPKYNNIHFFNKRLSVVLKQFAEIGYVPRFDDDGYFFDELGFVLSGSESAGSGEAIEGDEVVHDISIYREGYYEFYDEYYKNLKST